MINNFLIKRQLYTKYLNYNLKRIFLFILLFQSLNAFAQRAVVKNIPEHEFRQLHFGFTLGINFMDFEIAPSDFAIANAIYPEVSQLVPGFNINIVSNLKLNRFFDLRFLPGIAFGQRNIGYFLEGGIIGEQQLESSFLEFPLILKYSSVRVDNYRPYIIAGVNARYDLAKNFNEDDLIFLSLNRLDYYFEFGVGMDFYLPYFRFSTELKYAKGFRDVLNRVATTQPLYRDSMNFLKSNLLIFSFHFE